MPKGYPCNNCGRERQTHNPGLCQNCRKIAGRGPYEGKYTDQKVRRLTLEEAAWLGAMLEGEGTIRLRGRKSPGDWVSIGANTLDRLVEVDQIAPTQVSIYSSDVETISTCLRLAGAGSVTYRPPGHHEKAFSKKDQWEWHIKHKQLVRDFLVQVRPYLTSKRILVALAIPVAGGSCHPVHMEGPPAPGVSEEQVEKNWREFKKENAVDPRAIKRHHKWKPGHEIDYDEPESGWRTLNIKWEGEKAPPDQRHLLKGGPPSGVPCVECNEETRIVGEMSRWEQMNQHDPAQSIDVRPVNIDQISEERKKELQKEMIVILACPQCLRKLQWDKEFLPKSQ